MATPENPSNYQYKRLPDGHIRLLRLSPGPRYGMPAISEIFSCLLEDSPEYEALSYVWDKPLCIRTIALGEDKQIDVSVSVFLALKWLQQQTSGRLMWIDAICINQDQGKEATKEREAQVKMMGKIYAKAKMVIMHFGLSALRYEAETITRVMHCLQRDEALLNNGKPVCIRKMVNKISEEDYFTRTWTIQEVILAKEAFILLGDRLLSWSKLTSKLFEIETELNYIEFQDIPIIRVQRLLDNNSRPGLWDILMATTRTKATDQRDKVYALLGLIEGYPEQYPVRYDPWTSAMVFAHYTYRFCEERNSLDVLEASRHISPTSIKQLPSWAIDFARSPKNRELNTTHRPWFANSHAWPIMRFYAHDHLPLSIKLELGQELALECRGRKVGEILFVSQSKLSGRFFIREKLETLSEHLNHLARPIAEWSSLSDFLVSFLCTHICDLGDSKSKIEELVREEMKNFKAENGEDLKSLVQRLVKHFTTPNSVFSHLAGRIVEFCRDNSLFTTDNHFMGLGSSRVLPGDIVCVLNGARMPFILRRTNTTKKEYEVVCKCYVYGIMQGEWMRDVKEDDLEWFRLV